MLKKTWRQLAVLIIACSAAAVFGAWARPRVAAFIRPETSASRAPGYLVLPESELLQIEQLAALGYAEGVVEAGSEPTGVVLHDEARAQPGLNLYCSFTQRGAQLIDMKGEVVHRWESDYGGFRHVEVFPDGSLVVVVVEKGILKLDRDSRLLWSLETRAHHDLDPSPDGMFFALVRKGERLPRIHPNHTTVVDYVSILSAEGQLLREYSLLESVERSPHAFLLRSLSHLQPGLPDAQLDILHANHLERLDGSLASFGPKYREGNLLVSMRHLNAVAILDGDTLDIVWLWGPNNLTLQHHPTMLPNGRVLLFNNGTEQSTVLEVDPRTDKIEWQYTAPGFFSEKRGSNQRLANGNTLITESDRGRVFEVTPEGEVVWEFVNPATTDDGKREALWRMVRLDPENLAFLDSR